MKKAIILYILLLVTVTGCIKENLDDCETTLYFSYLGDGTKEIFPQKIEKVDQRHTDKRRFILAKQPCRSPALFYERVDIDQ